LEEVHNPTIYVTTSFTDIHSSLTLKTYQKYVPLLHEKLVVQNIVESCCEWFKMQELCYKLTERREIYIQNLQLNTQSEKKEIL